MYTETQVERVITEAGVKIMGNGPNDFSVFCPFHSNHRTPAGEISHEKGLFYCFSCKRVATLEEFVQRVTGCSYFAAARLIDKHRRNAPIGDLVSGILDKPKEDPEFDPKVVQAMHEQALQTPRAMEYYAKRGINEDTIKKFKLGYSSNMDMITLPFMNALGNKYLGMEGRSIEGKQFLTSGPKTKTLFGLKENRWSNHVFLTESTIDCLRINQLGYPAVSSMGTSRGKVQTELLKKYFGKVYIIQDNDTAENSFAGQASAEKTRQRLAGSGIIIEPPEGYKDIGEMPDEEIVELVAAVNNIAERV